VTRAVLGAGLLVWVGATLLLAGTRRFSRPSLADRLRPFHAGAERSARSGLVSVESVRDVVGPLARTMGDRVAALFGVTEQLELRLRRVHSPLDVTAFRTRQLAWGGIGLLAGLLIAVSGVPLALGLLGIAGGPLLAFLVLEQRLAQASERWQQTVAQELPIISEQIAMLLNAGYSLGAAVSRVAGRGQGCCVQDLRRVTNRIRQGVGEGPALREWSEVVRVDALDRLVAVLALNRETADLGRLVSTEARQSRRDLQRRTTEVMERRAQQVWVPVTVATLVPGVILLAVPFLAALRLFSSA
jgi:tight adherence protein C